eukprot:1188947-Prorocentrum_minimum.AAC.3
MIVTAGCEYQEEAKPKRVESVSEERTRGGWAGVWRSSTVDTSIPFSAWHFEYSAEYSTHIPCRQTAIGRPTVDSCPQKKQGRTEFFIRWQKRKTAY